MSSEEVRRLTRELARRHLAQDDPVGWFEALYAGSGGDPAKIPWAELTPKRHLVAWAEERRLTGGGRRALVVGCGLGDDAAFLAERGFAVTAFDLSPAAVAWAERRFPEVAVTEGAPDGPAEGSAEGPAGRPGKVRFQVADLLAPPAAWRRSFDLVLDVYTVQALPPDLHRPAFERLAELPAAGGTLFLLSYSRRPDEAPPAPPWPLLRDELAPLTDAGLEEVEVRERLDPESDPPVRRLQAEYRRPTGS